MHKKWFSVLILLYIGYALVFYQPKQPNFQGEEELKSKYEFLDKINAYAEILTADPTQNSLVPNKEEPLLKPIKKKELDEFRPGSKLPQSIKSKSISELNKKTDIPNNSTHSPELKYTEALQNKAFNMLYNVLHTPQGGALVEKLLLSPPVNEEKKELDLYRNNSKIDILQGEGDPAGCGDVVTIHYITRLVSGQEIENSHQSDQAISFQLGDQQVIKGLEYAVIGMKKGGIRRLVVPPRLAYNKEKFSRGLIAGNEFVTLDVELIDIKSSLQDWKSIINIIESDDNKKGRPVLCGDKVNFKYKISNLKEKVFIKSDKTVSFSLGSTEVPPVINKIFADIRSKSKRAVLVPSSSLVNKKVRFFPRDIKLPAKELLLIEIETNR